ncbi:F5/8 type C domain protein [compost metagenome]
MANFIPVTNPAIPNGDFYFIMCENINKKKILVADRNIQNGVSWNTLNTAGIINGVKPEIISNDTFTTSNISINGHVVSASEALSTYDAYKAFDGNFVNSSCWAIPPNKSGWLSYKYDNARKIVKYKIYPNGTNYTQAPKNWTFEGSNNGVNWIILDTQTNQTGWNGSGKSFSITNNQKFIYFRINISVFNGATDASSIGELQLFEEQEGYDFVIRLLTGGTSSTDRDNEWDKYIANSTLNNTITAGDNNIWNWNSIWSMTSTTNTNGSGNRSARGNSTAASSSYIDTSTVVSGNTGFRPVLVVEIFDLIKSFIKDSEGFKKWVSSTAAVIENVSLNKNVTATGFTSNISGNFSSVVDGIVTHDGTKYNYGNSLATTNTISTDNMIIDLGQIYTIGEIKARLAAGGDTQWNERADILCSQDNVTYTPYGYIRHTSAPLDVQLVNRTNNGEVKARYVKITNFMQGVGTYSRPTVDEIQVFSIVTPSVPASWQTVSTTLPSVDTFKNEGIRDLSILNRNSTIFSNTMETNGTLGQGKTFKSSINLKKLIEIINIKVE